MDVPNPKAHGVADGFLKPRDRVLFRQGVDHEYKSWRILATVLDQLNIQVRFNTRAGQFEVNEDDCVPHWKTEQILTYVAPERGWHVPDDTWDAKLLSYIQATYLWKADTKKARKVTLSFTDSSYRREMNALCGQCQYRVDPFLQYVETCGQVWDKKPRLDKLFSTYYQCEDSDRSKWFARYLFCAPIYRTVYPGKQEAKFDTIPIITGKQGLTKSTFLENVLPEDLRESLFSGSVNLADRDDETVSMCRGRAIIEVGEMAGIFGREFSSLKQFVAQKSDTFRPKYGKRHLTIPRTWIAIGTADKTVGILPSDPAGNRRWPVLELEENRMTEEERFGQLDRERDMLWGEAWHLVVNLKTAVHWTRELQAQYGAKHRDYEACDEWMINAIEEMPSTGLLTVKQVADSTGLSMPGSGSVTRQSQQRIIAGLRYLGYEQVRYRDSQGRRVRGWRK